MCKGNIGNQEIITSEVEEITMEEENKTNEQSMPDNDESKEDSSIEGSEEFRQVVQIFKTNGIIYGNSVPNPHKKKQATTK